MARTSWSPRRARRAGRPAPPAPAAATSWPGSRAAAGLGTSSPAGPTTPAVTRPGLSRSPTTWCTPGATRCGRTTRPVTRSRSGSDRTRGHRRAQPGQRDAVLLEPDPCPRGRGPGPAGHRCRSVRRLGHHTDREDPRQQVPRAVAFLPLADGKRLPAISPHTLPGDLYFVVRRVAAGAQDSLRQCADQLGQRSQRTGLGTSVGAFMVNGVLYKANKDGWAPSRPSTARSTVPRAR